MNTTREEISEIRALALKLRALVGNQISREEEQTLWQMQKQAIRSGSTGRDIFGFNPIVIAFQTALLAVEEMDLKGDAVKAILAFSAISHDVYDEAFLKNHFSNDIIRIIHGLTKTRELYRRNASAKSENFRNLLISFAEDMRVILIMIADRLCLLRQMKDSADDDQKREVAEEAGYLYAPLAHKLGLYRIKSELEDLSLKYLEHDAYYMIREKLSSTKRSRDEYIERFIGPIEKKLMEAGLRFHMKGRTKSIHSIWQKMKKQKCGFEGIYDLFAIRIIIDSPLEKEKMQCWQAYSIVTDMYQPNPKRLRDWLSVPKSNGYESLHITVLGPENKWVEVQIRTERMDEIAERGLAAHWRYKGIKGESGIDEWLGNIRSALEAGNDAQLIDQFRTSLYEDEVYVFTPRGDLLKFPKGATILDFAYHIHSAVGNKCIGGKINGRNVPLREVLHSGDEVEIVTSNNQKPKQDWLKIVKSPRAKSKIRLALKETQTQESQLAKEMLERKFKNRKIEVEEGIMSNLIKKMGFKENSDFYKQLAEEKLDASTVVDKYIEFRDGTQTAATRPQQSAEEFNYENPDEEMTHASDDVLVIGKDLKGIDYSLAKCCHPIYGDNVFGFVTSGGGIKVHRIDCPNAPELRRRFGYRIVKAKWSGKGNSQYSTTLRVIGNDDIGIVNNITSIISKEEKIAMRSINIDSNDGLFCGNIVVQLEDTSRLEALIKKMKGVKGVKSVDRL